MILLGRRRLIFWLFRAYIKKWRKTILASFVFGFIIFAAVYFGWSVIVPGLPFNQHMVIGIQGSYSSDNLPTAVLERVSKGLTYVSTDGTIKPDLVTDWKIQDNGKTYVFNLKKNIYFSDGTNLTSDTVNYNFIDVKVEKPSRYTIVFKLKENYSPFLVTVSKPLFKTGFVGIGEYRISSVDLNGNFVNSVTLISNKVKNKTLTFQFYPTEDALKNSYVIGDVDKILDVDNLGFGNSSFSLFSNTTVDKNIDYRHLVTLFYNTQDRMLSDKRLREALSYSLPDSFSQGKRNYSPFPPVLWAYQDFNYQRDYAHAGLLMSQSQNATESGTFDLTIQTLPQFEQVAHDIANSWKNIKVNATIKVVNSIPANFQIFLGEFELPKDPDQYTLWHSDQINNITNYKSLRIDKLLEDGRQTVDRQARIKIYSDFQKYLLDDAPASFLYFPFKYTVTRNSLVNY